MNYQILGGSDESDAEKLEKFTGEVGWPYLRPHAANGNLYWVDPELELRAVARAFQEDSAAEVATWLGRGDLVQVGNLHAAQWEGGGERFLATVVSPFVLMQPLRPQTRG